MKFKKKIITLYMLLLITNLVLAENIIFMPELSMPEEKVQEIQEIVDNAEINVNNIIEEINPQKIIEESQKIRELDKEKQKELKILKFKKDNIPLISSGLINIPTFGNQEDNGIKKEASGKFKLGLYKKDIFNIGLSITNIGSKYFLFSKIKALHVEKSFENIINEYKEIKNFLEEIDKAINQQELLGKPVNEIYSALKTWTYDKHQIAQSDLFGLNFLFNKQIGPLIIGNFLFGRLNNAIESNYSFPDYDMMRSEGLGIAENYEKTIGGTIEKSTISTYSPLSIIRFFNNNQLYRSRMRQHISRIAKTVLPKELFGYETTIPFLSNLLSVKIPSFLFNSKLIKAFSHFKNLYYEIVVVKVIDNYYKSQWSNFIVHNYKKLMELMSKYDAIKAKEDVDGSETEIRNIKDQIKKFVLDGHQFNLNKLIFGWLSSKEE